MSTSLDVDLLIVGAGIAGSGLACALRRCGYRIAIVERRTGLLDTARGDHLQPRTAEVLEEWGALAKFFERGAGKRMGAQYRTASGRPVFSWSYDEAPLKHPYFLIFHHDQIAELLLELAMESPGTTLLRGFAVNELGAGEDGVREVLAVSAEGEQVTIRPHLVVAADGVSSRLRAMASIDHDETHYEHPLVTLFGPSPEENPRSDFLVYAGRGGLLVVAPRLGGEVKIGFPVEAAELPRWRRSTAADRRSMLAERVSALADFDSRLAGFYPIRMVHARRYYRGNFALIGDAAHAVHPARGQGMNMALQGVQVFVESLPAPARIGDARRLEQALHRYETRWRPLSSTLMEENHRAGLEMHLDADELLERQEERFRALRQDTAARREFILRSSGYRSGASA
jgi:2-polyprenyl-6-methoxyphenol hydroxylase-like FAD-dependent oxidoreductase